jgi:hypothetical protein
MGRLRMGKPDGRSRSDADRLLAFGGSGRREWGLSADAACRDGSDAEQRQQSDCSGGAHEVRREGDTDGIIFLFVQFVRRSGCDAGHFGFNQVSTCDAAVVFQVPKTVGEAMPEKYLKIRDSLIASGKSSKEAKRIAAATYNKNRKRGQKPVTRKEHGE